MKEVSEMTLEEKLEKVKNFRPIDDVFFEVLTQNKAVCQEILRTILEDKDLLVEDVIAQSSERNIYGRSVRLDALCTLGSGQKVNIEVQRFDHDDHFRRVRFNASSITVKESEAGEKFENIIDLIMVYISEFDFIGGGKTCYHVDKVIRETGKVIDDGVREVYVNTVVDDGTDIADLMSCFTKKLVNNPKFPEFSAEVTRLKTTEGGVGSMCEVMRHYEDIARDAGRKEGIAAGRKEGMAAGRKEGIAAGRKEGMAAGRKEGMAAGRKEGIYSTLWSMVNGGYVSTSVAAAQCGMTEEAFLKTKPTT